MSHAQMMSIAAVERDTGLSKDTLRVWERRYGFPQPSRDDQGERLYPTDQIERLRLIKRLLDVGHRPGRLASLPKPQLQALTEQLAQDLAPSPTEGDQQDTLDVSLRLIERHEAEALRRQLAQALVTLGLSRFITELASPLMQAMGEGWLRGRFVVQQEHWVSHQVQQVLHTAIHNLQTHGHAHGPRILLTTLPGEPHGLGLLMVEAWLNMLHAWALNLGTQTPVLDVVQAAHQHRVDVVALGFTANAPASLVQDALGELRRLLPAQVQVWAGGQHPLLLRRAPKGVSVMANMQALSQAVSAWSR